VALMPDRYLTKRGKNALVTVAIIGGISFFFAVTSFWRDNVSLFQAVSLTIESFVWLLIFGCALWLLALLFRGLYLPIRYLRHSAALRRWDAREADLLTRAAAGDAIACVELSMKPSGRNPHESLWWRW
jgi:hypothetical protein